MSAETAAKRVRRRHVVYVQGYDPRGLAEYYRMFRTDYRSYCALYGLDGKIGKAHTPAERFSTTWPITTKGRGWEVETTYAFLRWEDIIRRDFTGRAPWQKIMLGVGTLVRIIANGMLWRVGKAAWRFCGFILYPYVTLLAHIAVSLMAWLAVSALAALVVPVPIVPALIGLAVAAAVLVLLIRWSEKHTYMLYMFDDIASHYQYAHRRRPDWEERFEAFAGYLVEAAQTSGADEILVIGHSSGSFVAVDILTRALARDPDLGRHGPSIVLLTIGANLPTVGFHPRAGWFRDRLRRLAVEDHIRWFDYQSRKDVMNFYPFDPVEGHGLKLGAARRNPRVVPVRFRDIIRPESYPVFRWRFFQVHFQFLRANQRPAAYDYFMITCGPISLPLRVEHSDDVVPAVLGDPTASEAAWKRLSD